MARILNVNKCQMIASYTLSVSLTLFFFLFYLFILFIILFIYYLFQSTVVIDLLDYNLTTDNS